MGDEGGLGERGGGEGESGGERWGTTDVNIREGEPLGTSTVVFWGGIFQTQAEENIGECGFSSGGHK